MDFKGLLHHMRTHKIAAIPGDGIGIEVINEGIRGFTGAGGSAGRFSN